MDTHLGFASTRYWASRLALAAGWLWWAAAAVAAPSVALFYGPAAPLDELKAFDIAVVEPGYGYDPVQYRRPYSELYAYVSVGEVHPTRPYFKLLPAAARLAANADWGSVVIDQSQPEWPGFVAEEMVAPLWARGYRGFFLDTLDAYRRADKFSETAQQQGLIRVIKGLHQRFPGIRLIMNRGFDLVPAVKGQVQMVAAESLFRGWDAGARRYVEVPARDREWLLGQLQRVRDSFHLPVLAVDYVPAGDRELARATAERIKALGIVPWVADGGLGSLGIGQVEVMPRKIIALYDGRDAPAIDRTDLHRFAEMPLNHLGYTLEYHDINRPLPDQLLAGRIAGIVLWLNSPPQNPKPLSAWMRRQAADGIKLAVLGRLRDALDGAAMRALGLAAPALPAHARLVIERKDGIFGLEAPPVPDRLNFQPLRLAPGGGTSLLEISDRGQRFDAAAITPWGGYVLSPFVVAALPGSAQARWVVDPFAFLQRALGLPDMPVPDVTTENGRRLMFVSIDGEGLSFPAEFPGTPLAGTVLAEEVLTRYRLPTTIAFAEGEIAGSRRPADAAATERIARRLAALPYVEVAGSAGYVKVGQAGAGRAAGPRAGASWFAADGGGKTCITRANPSLTAVAPLGIEAQGERRIYAAIADESFYTDFWRGPFYGFQQVIETLQMTDRPRRLKPVHVSYHFYSASKKASLHALRTVYDWALEQPVQVIHASDYLGKAGDFYTAVVARDGDAWLYRGEGHLRTLRAPAALGFPAPAQSSGLAGFSAGAEGHYLHLAGGESRIRFGTQAPQQPYLVEANARVLGWSAAGNALDFSLQGHQALRFTLANAAACRVSSNDKVLTPRTSAGATAAFHLDHATARIRVHCPGP